MSSIAAGKVLGRHGGIHGVTVGQRRGLGISAAEPLYVVEIDDEAKRVVVGKKNELSCARLDRAFAQLARSAERRGAGSRSADPIPRAGSSPA